MSTQLTLSDLLSAVVGLGALQFLVALWLSERFKAQLQRENAAILESLRWDLKSREQAAKVAEYMAAAQSLTENDSSNRYLRVNQLSWELALWLPTDVYRLLGQAVTERTSEANETTVLIQVRQHLLNTKAGDLLPSEIVCHAPGIGKHRALKVQSGG